VHVRARAAADFPKFGLSPINVDRVDLERFPALTHATPPLRALLQPGDALYLPNGWWHVITSTGRNVAVALEIEPFATSGLDLWPSEMRAAQNTPGLYWCAEHDTRKHAARKHGRPLRVRRPSLRWT
jgi:hypothetical protein